MRKMKIGKTVVQKVYVVVMIVLLLGVLAMQNEQLFGDELFANKSAKKQPAQYALNDIKALYTEATNYKVQHDSIIVFSKDDQIGWVYNTSPVSDSIVGYTSSVPLFIGFDNTDKVVGVSLLKNYESPDFVQDIRKSGFMESWNHRHIMDIAHLKVDVVSGATLTSSAIIKTIKHSTGKISNQSVSLSVPLDFMAILKTSLGYLLIVLALLQFFIPKKVKKIRTVFQVMVVVILGFWSGTFLSLFAFNNWMIHGIDLPAKIFVSIILMLSIILPLITSKSFYCSHLCPFGASQDLLGKIKKDRIKLAPHVKQFLSTLREKVFACIMLLLFIGVSFDLTNIEPFSAFLFRSASIPVVILAVSFLLLSIFIPRAWCNYVCPTGFLLETIRKPFKK